ncbi:hypothetical protein [Microbacterium kribbense]
MTPGVVDAMQSSPQLRALALVDRMASIADDARTGRIGAYAAGNAWLGARLGDSELRALEAMADRFKIDHDALADDHRRALETARQAAGLARAVDRAVEQHPELAEILAAAADAEGIPEIAAMLRNEPTTDHETSTREIA